MADFKTHITTSTAIGIAYGGAAYGLYEVPLSTSLLAGGLCAVSGMLPDLDSNSGRPLRESVALAAAVVPMMLAERMRQFEMPHEAIVLVGAAVYLVIRFGLAWILKRYTVHRGMFHSLPAALIFFEIAFLLASGPDVALRWYKAGGVLLGYLTHLVLDELWAVQWLRGRWQFKKSFGTALKLFGKGFVPNVTTYGLLALLSFTVFHEPEWMERVHGRYAEAQARFWERQRARLEAMGKAGGEPDPRENDAGTAPAEEYLRTARNPGAPGAGPDRVTIPAPVGSPAPPSYAPRSARVPARPLAEPPPIDRELRFVR